MKCRAVSVKLHLRDRRTDARTDSYLSAPPSLG